MTSAAGACIRVFFIADIARLVHGMAFAVAGFELLPYKMRFVAGATCRNIGMRGVAIVACQLGMLAGEFLQLIKRTAVAGRA